MKEKKFKDVAGYEGNYLVSESGLIKSVPRQGTKNKILNPNVTKYGYARVSLRKDGKRKSKFVHVITAIAFVPNPKSKPFVNHIDGNKLNNHKDNLEWVDASENAIHAYGMGLRKAHPVVGENHYASKLKGKEVLEIRASNLSQLKLSKVYGVSAGVIQRIKQRKSWKRI